MAHKWNPKTQRYRTATGRAVSPASVEDQAIALGEKVAQDLLDNLDELCAGSINVAQWHINFATLLRKGITASAILAFGGKEALSVNKAKNYGRIGNQLKAQYKYLNRFSNQMDDESVDPCSAGTRARVVLYSRSVVMAYFKLQTDSHIDAGFTQERRKLRPAEHCECCVAESNKGWQPIGTLKPLGACTCLLNCRCYKEFRTT